MRLSRKNLTIFLCAFFALDVYAGVCGAFELGFEGTATGIYRERYALVCKPFHFLDEHLYGMPSILTLPPYFSFESDLRGDPAHPQASGLLFSFIGAALRLLVIGFICSWGWRLITDKYKEVDKRL